MGIEETIAGIGPPDQAAGRRAERRLDSLTKPPGSLGKLEELACRLATITGELDPPVERKVIPVFAADHGVVEEGVSAYPQEVTAQMVGNFLAEGAAINSFSDYVNAEVVVVDVGVAEELHLEKVVDKKIACGTNNIVRGPAMSREEALSSLRAGMETVEELNEEQKVNLLGVGEMGIGNTTSSSAISSILLGKEPRKVTGSGTGLDAQGLKRKMGVIEKALAVNGPDPGDPIDVLRKVGGFEIGAIAGCLLQAASLGIPAILDGFITAAAALIAYRIRPGVVDYLLASHLSAEEGHRYVLEELGLEPLLDLELRLGEGTGAALAMNLVLATAKVINDMNTFAEAGISPGPDE